MDLDEIRDTIVKFIKKEVEFRKINGVVVGVSGGIDSAVVACLATISLGKENVFGLIMPDKDIDAKEDVNDALLICNNLGINNRLIYVNEVKHSFFQILKDIDDKLLIGNLVARIRMCILYYYSGLLNKIVLGTSNKSELITGYFTKYGDGASDLLPIGELYKTDVIRLARHLKIPTHIADKKSSARLWNNQFTENEIGFSFEILDSILKFLYDDDKNFDLQILQRKFPCISNDSLYGLLSLIKKNSHKISFPPICKLNL